MDLNELNEVTREQAERALRASSQVKAGMRVVPGTMAGLPFPWNLAAAIAMVRNGDGVAGVYWHTGEPGGKPGLVLTGAAGTVLYRFETLNPFELAEPTAATGRVRPARRSHLRVIAGGKAPRRRAS